MYSPLFIVKILGQHAWQLYSVVRTFIHIDKYTKCDGMSIQ